MMHGIANVKFTLRLVTTAGSTLINDDQQKVAETAADICCL